MILHSIFKSTMETILPDPPPGDFFKSHGTLSPEQFVYCGDILSTKYKSWSWESGVPEKRWTFLPENKQYLITRNIPSNNIIDRQEYKLHDVNESEIEDEWTYTEHKHTHNSHKIETTNISEQLSPVNSDDEDFDYNIDDENDNNNIICNDELSVKTRTYDIYITYDKYYQTPRIWLFGYNYDGMPLGFKEIVDDIQSEYINKTVTYDNHPHLPLLLVAIHPCRHPQTMKKLIENKKDVKLEDYFFIFLKFISSIIPNINYDHTHNI